MIKNEVKISLAIIAGLLLLRRPGGIAGPIRAKTRFLPVYVNGKPNPELVRADKRRPGVYLIKVRGELRYIGHSASNVYKTLTRHFQSWEDRSQVRITYPKASYVTGRVVYTNTGRQAAQLETALILKHRPPDNPKKYEQAQMDFSDLNIVQAYTDADTGAPF